MPEGHVDLLCQLHGHNATTHYGKLVEHGQSDCYTYFTKINQMMKSQTKVNPFTFHCLVYDATQPCTICYVLH